jgi:hypothetical protein
MRKLAYSFSFLGNSAHPGETTEKLNVIEERLSKARRGFGIVLSNAIDDLSQIV